MSYPVQFKNFVVFDHSETGLSALTMGNVVNENTEYATELFSPTNGAALENCIVIGNSDSSASTSISESGVVLAWDRGERLENVSFYNFPNSNSRAIRGPIIDGKCEWV